MGKTKRKYSPDFSISVLAPQNAALAPISISANQTGEYTAARRTVSMPEPPITIVILLIYRSLGGALPPKYHTDRRGVRWESITLGKIQIRLQEKARRHFPCVLYSAASSKPELLLYSRRMTETQSAQLYVSLTCQKFIPKKYISKWWKKGDICKLSDHTQRYLIFNVTEWHRQKRSNSLDLRSCSQYTPLVSL